MKSSTLIPGARRFMLFLYVTVVGSFLFARPVRNIYSFLPASSEDSLSALTKTKEKYINTVDDKMRSFDEHATKYSSRTIDKAIRLEEKMKAKVAKVDPKKAEQLFNYAIDSLKQIQNRILTKTSKVSKFLSSHYFPYLDTLQQSLSFLKKGSTALDGAQNMESQVAGSMNQADQLSGKLENMDELQRFLQGRTEVLKDQLKLFPQLSGSIQKLSKQTYYWNEQIKQYKATLQDPDKIEQIVLGQLQKIPAFQKLIQQNGQLSGIFASLTGFGAGMPEPASGNIPVVNGLATQGAIQQYIQSNVPSVAGSNPLQNMQQQLGDVDGELGKLQDKLNQIGGSGSTTMPDFVPNNQRSKPFLKRLRLGTELQFGPSINYLPANSNIALTLGYKLDDKFTTGVGVSYILGLGQGWNHIHLASEGIGFRTFLSWNIKKGFSIRGGSEWNYVHGFTSIQNLQTMQYWQQSALLGISKQYSISKKLKGNVQILYDFLYRQHIPQTQPIIFRFGVGQ